MKVLNDDPYELIHSSNSEDEFDDSNFFLHLKSPNHSPNHSPTQSKSRLIQSKSQNSKIFSVKKDTEKQDPKLNFLEGLILTRIRQSQLDYNNVQGSLKS